MHFQMALPDMTEMEVTSTASASVDTSGYKVTHRDGHDPGMPRVPIRRCCRMWLWNQCDTGWNIGNQDDGDGYVYDEDYDKDYGADDEVEGNTLLQFRETIYWRITNIIVFTVWTIARNDVQRPTIEHEHRVHGLRSYKDFKYGRLHGTLNGWNWPTTLSLAIHNRRAE